MRLTNAIRETIVNKLIEHRFAKQAIALRKKRAKLAKDVYSYAFTKAQREILTNAPKGWFKKERDIVVNLSGERHRLYFGGDFPSYGDPRYPLRVMTADMESEYLHVPYDVDPVIPVKHKLAVRIAEANGELSDLIEEIQVTTAKTKASLGKIHSVKHLLEQWPEVRPFLPKEDQTAALPAIPTKDLNKLLDLPASEAA